jgi:hypothetical protein
MENVNAMLSNSDIYVTMERYSYNLWAIIALILTTILFKTINNVYIYNIIVVIILVAFFLALNNYSK